MTQITKRLFAIIVLVAVGFVSGSVWAQDRPSIPDRSVAFCQRVKANKGDESALLSELETVTESAQAQTLKRLQDRKAEQATQIQDLRENTKFEFKSNIKNLSAKARTPEQKQAVQSFDARIQKALAQRQSLVDSAQENFRNSFNQIVKERQAKMTNAVTSFRSDYRSIFQTAVAQCNVPGGSKAARDNFITSAKAIRKQLVVQLSPSQSIAETKPLAIARNLLIKEANSRFLTELTSAEQELRAKLK